MIPPDLPCRGGAKALFPLPLDEMIKLRLSPVGIMRISHPTVSHAERSSAVRTEAWAVPIVMISPAVETLLFEGECRITVTGTKRT